MTVTISLPDLLHKIKSGSGIYELLRFVLVGGLATLTDLCVTMVLFFCSDWMSVHENSVTTLAFCVAFFVSYFGHRFFTFHHQGSILHFLLLSGSMLILRNILVYAMVSLWMRGLPPIILAMAAVTVLTYLISKYKIFAEKKRTDLK